MAFIPHKVIVHHSLTRDSGSVSWGAIRKYHIQQMKWSGIGYHAGVELVLSGDAVNYEILMGRVWDKSGAHTRGENSDSLAICFVGNYDITPPPKQMIAAGSRLIALWLRLFNLTIKDIYSHHYFNTHKSCPGIHFDMEYLLTCIRGKL